LKSPYLLQDKENDILPPRVENGTLTNFRRWILKNIGILLVAALLLCACGSAPVHSGSYQFVPPPTPGKVIEAFGFTDLPARITVKPLAQGEWVVIHGTGGYLLPSQRLGQGDKCFVVGITGSTNSTYAVTKAINLSDFIGVSSSFDTAGSFSDAFSIWQQAMLQSPDCKGGLDVWTINK
jgi:hypothetical protein